MSILPKAIVFFDLDGTLLTKEVRVARSSIQAIHKLKQNNILPVLATGRTVCEIEHVLVDTGIDSVVAMNGQYVCYKQQELFTNRMDPSELARLYEFARQRNIDLSFYNNAQMRISRSTQDSHLLYAALRAEKEPAVDPQFYLNNPVYMVLLICQSGEDEFPQQFPDFYFIRNTPYCVDVFNQGGSKANGITKLLEAKQFTSIPTYAFGDGMNDFEMFKLVDHPIAMGNAVGALKDLAEFVTDDNNNDGIFNGLKQAGLI